MPVLHSIDLVLITSSTDTENDCLWEVLNDEANITHIEE